MINLGELSDYEKFEDLCEELLCSKGLKVRRLGRGPGQLGKDMLAIESRVGSLSNEQKTWLVEVKFTRSGRSLSENDISNVTDRVKSQKADGFLLMTNARLGVNLEKILHKINENAGINVMIWTKHTLIKEVLASPLLHREYFPDNYRKYVCENRSFFLAYSQLCKSPLTYMLASIKLLNGLYNKPNSEELVKKTLIGLESVTLSLIEDVDSFCGYMSD